MLSWSACAEDAAGFCWLKYRYQGSTGKVRNRELYIWYPSMDQPERAGGMFARGWVAAAGRVKPGKHPVLVFSHGYRAGGMQVVYLMEALARSGFIVISTNHADSLRKMFKEKNVWLPLMYRKDAWHSPGVVSRREDLNTILEMVLSMNQEKGAFLHGHVDADRIGIIGYSLGSYTALGMLGAVPEWKDERFKSALLLAPFMPRSVSCLCNIEVPTMIQSGSLDLFISGSVPGLYRALPNPSQWLVVPRAHHFTWTNLPAVGKNSISVIQRGAPQLITEYAVAFFQETLRQRKEPLLRKPNPRLRQYRWKPE